MGSGVTKEQQLTVDQANARLQHIETLMEQISHQPRPPVGEAPDNARTTNDDGAPVLNLGGKKKKKAGVQIGEPPASEEGGAKAEEAKAGEVTPRSKGVTITDDAPVEAPPKAVTDKAKKKQLQQEVKAKRKGFFEKIPKDGDKVSGVKCVWLGSAAVSLSYIAGKTISMEEIFVKNRLALHYVSMPSVTMSELYDIVAEFIDGHESFKGHTAEMITLDKEMIDVDDEGEGGDPGPLVSLVEFRKELLDDFCDQDVVHIFNYNPYVVQEAEDRLNEDEDEEEDLDQSLTPRASKSLPKPKMWAAKNMGNFAVLLSFNAALNQVTIGTPHLGVDGFIMETHTVSVSELYHAAMDKDGYTKRPRGFIRIKKSSEDQKLTIDQIFSVGEIDGSNSKGMLSIALDIAIAPHILGLGLADHLIRHKAADVNDSLLIDKGIRVSAICKTLDLPLHMIVQGSNKNSLQLACSWYQHYLNRTGMAEKVFVGMMPITRRDGAADGAVSLDEDDFVAQVAHAVTNGSVLLVNVDINIAQNVMVTDESAHFVVVNGFDPKSQVVQVADVSVKKFKKVWHLPIARFYRATIGYGYMCIATSAAKADMFGAVEKAKAAMALGRSRLPPGIRPAFEFPKKPYTISSLAVALNKLGHRTNVEDLLYHGGFHLSFLLSDHLSINDGARVLRAYVREKLNDMVTVTTTNFDNEAVMSLEKFRDAVKANVAKPDCVLIVQFSAVGIQDNSGVWTGSNGGSMAIVEGLEGDELVLSDANSEAYYRHWMCPVELMFKCCTSKDRMAERARGMLVVENVPTTTNKDTHGYDIRNAMTYHPFKPLISSQVSAVAFAISSSGTCVSVEEVVYSSDQFKLPTLSLTLKFGQVKEMAENLCINKVLPIAVQVPPTTTAEEFAAAVAAELTVVVFDNNEVFGFDGVGSGIVNRVANGVVQVADSNPTRFGDIWELPIEKLHKACTANAGMCGVLHFVKK